MLQNKIYQNFISEILKIFAVVLFALSIIALTVRAVNFLDLIVENGYPISTYFKNPSEWDFDLSDSSELKDLGKPSSITEDILERTRIIPNDLGCYEFQ